MRPHHRVCILAAAWAAVSAAPALAHDTWFERLPAPPGQTLLALGTGNQYPLRETGIDGRYLARRGCRAGEQPAPLQALRNDDAALVLHTPATTTAGTAACWVQLEPFEITLAPDKVELYLREVGAGPELRATWAAMQRRGLPWRERYTKHARIELGAPSGLPATLGMDLVIEAGHRLAAGTAFGVRVLRDGQPVAGLPVQLRSEDSPLGVWRRSDAQGRVQMPAPAPGRWLLRAIDLRTAPGDPDRWDSRFVTLAFDIGAPAAPTPQ